MHWRLGFLIAGLLSASSGLASPPAADGDADAVPAYSRKGADTCLRCHSEDAEFPVMAIFQSRHGDRRHPESPFNGLQCEACHGPGDAHARHRPRDDEPPPPLPNFGPRASNSAEVQNQACLSCHKDQAQGHWNDSVHAEAGLTCSSCHSLHTRKDPIKDNPTAVCGQCHAAQLQATHLPSAHPIRNGDMQCTDCHDPHGADRQGLAEAATPTGICADCHADKRGPFLWEHAPASEDCGLCHTPHGSMHPALLMQRPPLLCQQCHSAAGHPSVAHTPAAQPGSMISLGSCTNCHSQVHGSNHPSGSLLMR